MSREEAENGRLNRVPVKGLLSDLAYERILEALFDRRVPVGAVVSQSELVELIGVPIAPVRDALRVLETEGILTIQPRSGIRFVRPGLELTRATYQFRLIVERAAIRAYAEGADMAEIIAQSEQHSRIIADIERDDLLPEHGTAMEVLEYTLHHSVMAALQNPLIMASYRKMHNYLRLLRLEKNLTAPLALRTLGEHVAILDACLKRDADGAEKALQQHFMQALQRNLGMF